MKAIKSPGHPGPADLASGSFKALQDGMLTVMGDGSDRSASPANIVDTVLIPKS